MYRAMGLQNTSTGPDSKNVFCGPSTAFLARRKIALQVTHAACWRRRVAGAVKVARPRYA